MMKAKKSNKKKLVSRGNLLAIIGIALFVVLCSLYFCYYFMIKCEGDWKGTPLEDGKETELAEIEKELKADVAYMSVELGPRNPGRYEQLCQCADWIKERWESQGYPVKTQTYSVEGKDYYNFEIEIPGNTIPSEIVIVSCQYDTLEGSPGANNNGSGVALLLQLSKLLKNFIPDRTLRLVAFSTEEDPYFGTEMMGSYKYAKRSYEKGENIRAMLSLDALAYITNEPDSQKLPFPFSLFYPKRGNFLSFIGNLNSRRSMLVVTKGFKKGSSFPIECGVAPEWVEPAGWSDHISFWRFGYPGMQITDTGAYRSPYHTNEGDTIEKMDFKALARMAFGMYTAILELTKKENLSKVIFELPGKCLIINGSIILILGLLSGILFRRAIIKEASQEAINAWRVAHSCVTMDALMLLIIGIISPHLALGEFSAWILVWTLVISAYGFVVALIIGAWTGYRGLTAKPLGFNTVLYAAHIIGALGVLIGILLFIIGILKAF